MDETYNVGSDSDSGEEVISPRKSSNNKKGADYVEAIQKLKAQTNELLDPAWRENRNGQLLKKMLELNEPTITPKMVDFLVQEGVTETLVGYITQRNAGIPRPGPSAQPTPALILGYKATLLLTPEHPNNELMAVLSRKITVLSRACFDIFRPDSAGSFYHAFRLIDCLLRCFPGEFYDAICSDGHAVDRMASMLRYIGFAPVPDIFVCIVTLAPISRSSNFFAEASANLWTFLQQLSDWNLMLRIAEVVVRPKEFCEHSEAGVTLEQHSACAAQLLQDLSEKLSIEDTGELLLQPLGYTPEILDYLVFTGVNPAIVEPIRRASLKLLCFLLKRSSEPGLLCMVNTPGREQPVPTSVPNRMYNLRPLMVEHLSAIVGEIFRILTHFDDPIDDKTLTNETRHIGYVVTRPFTTMRLLLMEFGVCMVEASDQVAPTIPAEFWNVVMTWVLRYAYNNIFHSYFYRLLFACMRQNNETVLRIIFQRSRMLSFLCDAYMGFPAKESDILEKKIDQQIRVKDVCRGLVLNCLNSIRLQAAALPPESFFRQLVNAHEGWDSICAAVETDTGYQKNFGLGYAIPDSAQNSYQAGLSFFSQRPSADSTELGSRFANSLGFQDEVAWPDNANDKKKLQATKKRVADHRKRSESGESAASDTTASTADSVDDISQILEDVSIDVPTSRNSLSGILLPSLIDAETFYGMNQDPEADSSDVTN